MSKLQAPWLGITPSDRIRCLTNKPMENLLFIKNFLVRQKVK